MSVPRVDSERLVAYSERRQQYLKAGHSVYPHRRMSTPRGVGETFTDAFDARSTVDDHVSHNGISDICFDVIADVYDLPVDGVVSNPGDSVSMYPDDPMVIHFREKLDEWFETAIPTRHVEEVRPPMEFCTKDTRSLDFDGVLTAEDFDVPDWYEPDPPKTYVHPKTMFDLARMDIYTALTLGVASHEGESVHPGFDAALKAVRDLDPVVRAAVLDEIHSFVTTDAPQLMDRKVYRDTYGSLSPTDKELTVIEAGGLIDKVSIGRYDLDKGMFAMFVPYGDLSEPRDVHSGSDYAELLRRGYDDMKAEFSDGIGSVFEDVPDEDQRPLGYVWPADRMRELNAQAGGAMMQRDPSIPRDLDFAEFAQDVSARCLDRLRETEERYADIKDRYASRGKEFLAFDPQVRLSVNQGYGDHHCEVRGLREKARQQEATMAKAPLSKEEADASRTIAEWMSEPSTPHMSSIDSEPEFGF